MRIPYHLGDIIEQRYRIVRVLEKNRSKTTYEVEDLVDRQRVVAIIPFWQQIILILTKSPLHCRETMGLSPTSSNSNEQPAVVGEKKSKLIVKLASGNSKKAWLFLFLPLPCLIMSYYLWGLANDLSFATLFTTNLTALILLMSILVVLIGLVFFRENYLEIDRDNFLIQWKYWGFGYQVTGKTQDITDLEMRYYTVEDDRGIVENPYCCVIWEGLKQYKFASWLRQQEQEWLLAEISHFLTAECDGAFKVRKQVPHTAPCQRRHRRFTSSRCLNRIQAFMSDVAV